MRCGGFEYPGHTEYKSCAYTALRIHVRDRMLNHLHAIEMLFYICVHRPNGLAIPVMIQVISCGAESIWQAIH